MKRVQAIQPNDVDVDEQRWNAGINESKTPTVVSSARLGGSHVPDPAPAEEAHAPSKHMRVPYDPAATPTRGSRSKTMQDCRGEQGRRASAETSQPRLTRLGLARSVPKGFGDTIAEVSQSRGTLPDVVTSRPDSQTLSSCELKAPSAKDSATFGSPASHLFRTGSPYRRILRLSMEEHSFARQEDENPDYQALEEDGQIYAPQGDNIAMNTSGCFDDQYTESIYSTGERGRDTDQGAPFRLGKAGGVSLDRGPPTTHNNAGCNADSTISSADWKGWLSANLATVDSSPIPSRPSEVEYALPTIPKSLPRGHVRVSAQIQEDYDENTKAPEP